MSPDPLLTGGVRHKTDEVLVWSLVNTIMQYKIIVSASFYGNCQVNIM